MLANGSTLEAQGHVDVWAGGTLGALAGSQVDIASLEVRPGGSVTGNGTAHATTMVWAGGAISGGGSLEVLNVLLIRGPDPKTLSSSSILCFGETTWVGTGNIVVSGSSTIGIVGPTARFIIGNGQRIERVAPGDAVLAFALGAVLEKVPGSGTTTIDLPVTLDTASVTANPGIQDLDIVFAGGIIPVP